MLFCCQLSTLVKSLPRSGEIINHLIFESKALESLDLLKGEMLTETSSYIKNGAIYLTAPLVRKPRFVVLFSCYAMAASFSCSFLILRPNTK